MASLLVPEVVPSPTEDCEILRKAVEGFGTDEKAIIWILGHRNANQIKNIRETYQEMYNESLIDRLHNESWGDFRKALILWTYDPHERDARLAHEALNNKKRGIKHLQVLVEIACASSPRHLIAVRKIYCSLFDCSLEEDIVSHVAMPLRKVLLALVTSYRYDKQLVEMGLADTDAATLREAVNNKSLSNDDFVYILSTRSTHQLKQTFHSYEKNYGASLDEDIKECGNGDLESLLRVVIQCITCPEKHIAEVVGGSIIGLGTDEDTLTRCIVSRAEVDMKQIKSEYMSMYKTSLEDAVAGDTSGYYRQFLMTLLGAED